MPQPRVFVSSVIEGFAEYRHAPPATASNRPAGKGSWSMRIFRRRPARRGTPASTPSTATTSFFLSPAREEAGKRRRAGSWWRKNSSMQSARKLPVLVFLEDVPRDAEAERFARSLSDYVDGLFRVKFSGEAELGFARLHA